MRKMMTGALRPAALLLAGLLTAGCQSTLTAVSLPADSPWNQMASFVASPYDDLTAVATGTGIVASVLPLPTPVFGPTLRFCQGPAGEHELVPGTVPCTSGYTDMGIRYPWVVQVNVAADFTPGSVNIISNGDGSTAMSFALAKASSSTALNITTGFSEGTIPMPPPDTGFTGNAYTLDNYGMILFGPNDTAFGSGVSLSPVDSQPDLACAESASFPTFEHLPNAVLFRTSGSSLTATCGTRTINLTVTPPYKSVGECIADARKRFCASKGFKGSALSSCNAAQIGACQATFNVPSHLARELVAP